MDSASFRAIGPTTYLCPTPTVLVGCAADAAWLSCGANRPNLITIAWTGICCSKPPMLSISVRPERYSHALLTQSGEFTVNLISEELLHAMDLCGVKSGRDMDKFGSLGLHPMAAQGLEIAPALQEAPAYLSCKVRQVITLGSHDLFLAEIVDVCVRESFFNVDGSIDEQAMALVAFVHGKYRALGKEIGFFGYSVASEDVLRRRLPHAAAKQNARAGKRSGKRLPRKDGKA